MQNDWKKVYQRAVDALRKEGIHNVHFDMILFAMMYMNVDYDFALGFYADFRGEVKERMHSSICYYLLRYQMAVSPKILFTGLKEVNREN